MSFPSPFIPVDEPLEEINVSQLFFLTAIYAYVIFQASGFISDGSELLLLVPSVAGLVGSIVLPILGAVPDGVMMMFSGASDNPQEDIASGVGVLAGSTVMLLTLPWFIAIMYGGVPVVDGKAQYGSKEKPTSFFTQGIGFNKSIAKSAKIMLATTLLYLIIQIPATQQEGSHPKSSPAGQSAADKDATHEQAKAESMIALGACVACIVAFFGYLYICYQEANTDLQLEKIIEGIKLKTISLGAALSFVKEGAVAAGYDAELLGTAGNKRLTAILKPFFRKFDTDKSDTLDLSEFSVLLRDLGEGLEGPDAEALFKKYDKDKSQTISFAEFTECIGWYLSNPEKMAKCKSQAGREIAPAAAAEDDEEEEEVPEDLAELSEEEQQKKIKIRSVWMMSFGTCLVLIFSDPLVECFNHWGNNVFGISPFYVSFILAPLASNASELLAAYNYASKKTMKSITTSLSTLLGAACMNNTFCLAIFFFLIYAQGIAWQFTAETIAIVVSQWVIGALAIFKDTHTGQDGCIIISIYPLTLVLVSVLESVCGLD
jgi:hypothetical protein